MLVYDILAITQPEILKLLVKLFGIRRPLPLRKIKPVKVWCDDEFDFWEHIMTEKPKLGRGGILKEKTY